MLAPGSTTVMVLLGVAAVLLLVVLLRLFSVAWYLLKYYDFVLQRDEGDLRTEFGLLTRVSTLIPVRRIQLLTVSASLLHRCFGRAGIDLETAGAIEGGDDGDQLASLGLKTSRQWLAPIIAAQRASTLVRSIIPEIEIEHVAWQPLAARTTHRILRRSLLALAVLGGGIMTLLAWTPIPLSGWHALWVPAIGTPLAYFGTTAWVRYSGWALTDDAVLFRSGWLAQRTSAVLFDKMQTVTLRQSPFDRRHHMASVAVDTAGAGGEGHRIAIPYLDVEVAQRIFERLYAETRATEFNW
jgi:putative membrane protein